MYVRTDRQTGYTIVELLMSLAIAAMLLAAMTGLVNNALVSSESATASSDVLRDARFAMQRMTTAVIGTRRLMLPLADNPNTNWREHVREQTVPASPPEGDSTLATAVLAVTLDPTLDLDADGFADADNDKDGRVDEDLSRDATNDSAAGIVGIDDDGDGDVDEADFTDDDEDQTSNEDADNGLDDDGDGSIAEDTDSDINDDNEPGIIDVDDDGDGLVDEGNNDDDDEDGLRSEDWLDPVVFFLSGSTLMERRPDVPSLWGGDYTEHPIAENVSLFRVERIPDSDKRAVLVDITLELAPPGSDPVSLNTRVRVGGGQ